MLHLSRRLLAEALGTAFLLVAVVGSGVMAQTLSPDDVGLQLLENAVATGVALGALIAMFITVSGAHFNPAVTLAARAFGEVDTSTAGAYVGAQIVGACIGTVVANVMFELPAIELSTNARGGGALWLSEVIATLGLLLVIFSLARTGRLTAIPFAVGAWITGAYFFTSSTSFANPAVTVGRTLSNTFAGIRPASAPMFIAMQLVGAVLAVALIRVLFPLRRVAEVDV